MWPKHVYIGFLFFFFNIVEYSMSEIKQFFKNLGPTLLINYYYPSSPVSNQHLGEDLFRTFLYSFYSVYYFEAISRGFKSGSEDRPVGLQSLCPLLVI